MTAHVARTAKAIAATTRRGTEGRTASCYGDGCRRGWGPRPTRGRPSYAAGVIEPSPPAHPDPAHDALRALAGLDDVTRYADSVREACTSLRWHQALRRRIPEAAAESRIRGAAASAALEGAELPLDLVRASVVGARDVGPDPDPVERVVAGAIRATAESERVESLLGSAAAQALARLHVAAASELLPADQVGRPRAAGEACDEGRDLGPVPGASEVSDRLAGLVRVLGAPADIPAYVVAAIAHGEVMALRPFVSGNGLVARALERAVVRARGLDPTGVSVMELGHRRVSGDIAYRAALGAYTSGTRAGMARWLEHCAVAYREGVSAGVEVADAVLVGRLA